MLFGWEQPALPYHEGRTSARLSGNVLNNEEWDGHIYDYRTTHPVLLLTSEKFFGGDGTGTISIPIKYCPECGRKLGKSIWEA